MMQKCDVLFSIMTGAKMYPSKVNCHVCNQDLFLAKGDVRSTLIIIVNCCVHSRSSEIRLQAPIVTNISKNGKIYGNMY